MNNSKKLLDLGEWCGTDCMSFLKLQAFMAEVGEGESPQQQQFQKNFDMIHRCFELILKNP